jgi:hypothetical protein
MSTQPQPNPQQPNPINDAINGAVNNIMQQAVQQIAQHGPELAIKLLTSLFNSIFHKKPTAVPIAPAPTTPVAPNTPTPISVPVSVPTPGLVTRTVNLVRMKIQMAENPVMDGERPHDPGNLIDDLQGIIARGDNIPWNSTVWPTLTAYDQNNDEWLGNSIIAANKEYRSTIEVWKDGKLVGNIVGLGGVAEQQPNAGYTMQSDGENIDQVRGRPWLDSVGMTGAFRLHGQGIYTFKGVFDGVPTANSVDVHVS